MRVTAPLFALGCAVLVRAQEDADDVASSVSSAAESVSSSAASIPEFTVSLSRIACRMGKS